MDIDVGVGVTLFSAFVLRTKRNGDTLSGTMPFHGWATLAHDYGSLEAPTLRFIFQYLVETISPVLDIGLNRNGGARGMCEALWSGYEHEYR